MNLTFKGFLRSYCRELTDLQTDSLKKLLTAVLNEAPAAAEALMCFAAAQGKADYLANLASRTSLESDYRQMADILKDEADLEGYLSSRKAPVRYEKIWLAYRAKKEAIKADRRVIALMREKTLKALKKSHLTVYGLCKQLNLNRGNVYAYLNAGDVTKVSRDTARLLMEAAGA
ncbi:MAG: hypothetical protein ACI4B9_07750 [Eggerthellaceae bacterium]